VTTTIDELRSVASTMGPTVRMVVELVIAEVAKRRKIEAS